VEQVRWKMVQVGEEWSRVARNSGLRVGVSLNVDDDVVVKRRKESWGKGGPENR
jgi:hypothetical protein